LDFPLYSLLDGGDLNNNQNNQHDILNDIIGAGDMLGIPSLEKNFTVQSPFAALAANAQQAIPMN
jgi:hypothetical protein